MVPSISPSYPSFLVSFFPCLLFSFSVFLSQSFSTLLQLYSLFMFFHLIFFSPKFLPHQLGKYLFSVLSLTGIGASPPQGLSLTYSTTHSSIYEVSPHPSIHPSIHPVFIQNPPLSLCLLLFHQLSEPYPGPSSDPTSCWLIRHRNFRGAKAKNKTVDSRKFVATVPDWPGTLKCMQNYQKWTTEPDSQHQLPVEAWGREG